MNDDPYGNPSLYDLEYSDQVEDIEYYADLAKRHHYVLELACGTGRLTIPMARAGAKVHGIDNSAVMLKRLKRKLQLEPFQTRMLVSLEQADFVDFEVPNPYSLALLPFNAIHHCLDEQGAVELLKRIHRSVLRDGLFAMDCYLPDRELQQRNPDTRHEERSFIDPRSGNTLFSWEQSSYDEATQIYTVLYVYQDTVTGEEWRSRLPLRMFSLTTLREMFEQAGWQVQSEYSDFTQSVLKTNSLKWVGTLAPV